MNKTLLTAAVLVLALAGLSQADTLVPGEAGYIGDFSGAVQDAETLPTWLKGTQERYKLDWDGTDDPAMGVWAKPAFWAKSGDAMARDDNGSWSQYGFAAYVEAPDLTDAKVQFDYAILSSSEDITVYVYGLTGTGSDFIDADFDGGDSTTGNNIFEFGSETLSSATGTGSFVSSTPMDLTGYQRIVVAIKSTSTKKTDPSLTIDNLAIPEPATMSLLALGSLAALRRRRRA
jgi:hypothetical protein